MGSAMRVTTEWHLGDRVVIMKYKYLTYFLLTLLLTTYLAIFWQWYNPVGKTVVIITKDIDFVQKSIHYHFAGNTFAYPNLSKNECENLKN